MKILDSTALKKEKYEIPLVPSEGTVLFPSIVNPLFVTETEAVKAVDKAMEGDRTFFLAYPIPANLNRTQEGEEPYQGPISEAKHRKGEPSYSAVGTVVSILQILRLPDNSIRLLAEGRRRAQIHKYNGKKGIPRAVIREIPESRETNQSNWAVMETIKKNFAEYAKQQKNKKKIPPEAVTQIEKTDEPDRLIGQIINAMKVSYSRKLEILSRLDGTKQLEDTAILLQAELEIMGIQNDINGKVRQKIEKTQKEYYLNEQLKQIRKELGDQEDDSTGAAEIRAQLQKRELPREVKDKAQKELKRLSKLQPMSPESGVLRTYLEWILDLPWERTTEDYRDITQAARILDADHYDMKKPKERILDFIAVRQLLAETKGPILCLVGPPGTGKTSLGKSVARSLGREFVRISLGGVRDEAEIRGHRKTYVGALPGKIIQSMKKAGSSNPVFLLDEIDKMSSDFRGDPAAAMLEVLDPEQNAAFVDHYMEVSYDLSQVMFITTANSAHTIPRPLLDRMEIIEVPGYTELEKCQIARNFIIPKQRQRNGLTNTALHFSEEALQDIIRHYTMESGVRNLEKQIGQVMRKAARITLRNQREDGEKRLRWASWYHRGITGSGREEAWTEIKVNPEFVRYALGRELLDENPLPRKTNPGLARGLAWTENGGRVLPAEVTILPGKGELILTGSLGDVMKESCRIALSYLQSRHRELGLAEDAFKERDIHIHVPEGAIPKDGPSAGITMTAAILSAARGIPLRPGITMTGEITLTDQVLPIGGVKEKVLAAHRNHLNQVLLPERNRKDTEELPAVIRETIDFTFCSSVKVALQALFEEGSFPGMEEA